MEPMTLEDMERELAVLHPKAYRKDGQLRTGQAAATAEEVARCAELEQLIQAEKDYMESDDETPDSDTPTKDNRTPEEIIIDLTEQLRREKVITQAFKAPKGVGINKNQFQPAGEKVRIDQAMLPSLAAAERLPVSIPEALAEKLIDKETARLMAQAVERRFRCYVKKAGFHEDARTHKLAEWAGGLKKDLSPENIAKAKAWAEKLGRVDGEGKPIYEWDTTIVIPNM